MIKYVFSVRDRAADLFGNPFFVPATGVAIRSFSDEVNRADTNNSLYVHSEDYDLYQIGEFDDNTGTIKPCVPKMVCVGKEVAIRG